MKEISGLMVDNAATPQWLSEAVWDDRFHRFADANSDNLNDFAGQYGHGFIDPAFRPRDRFDANDYTPAGAFNLPMIQQRFQETWQAWDAAAKAQGQNSRTEPDGSLLRTSVVFEDVGTVAAAEILIDLVPGMEAAGGPYAEWIISPTQPNAANGNAALRTLVIEPNPTTQVWVYNAGNPSTPNASWQLSSDGGTTFAAKTPQIALGWNFTAGGPANLAQLIKYKCVNAAGCGTIPTGQVRNGNEADFTALN